MFYHGTAALPAVCVTVDGFRLLDRMLRAWDCGCIGSGIYLTAAPRTARWFSSEAGYLLCVRLKPGTRILRLDGGYDQAVLESLRREFGTGILSAEFDRAIPRNKKLRRVEFINLFNYLWGKGLFGSFSDEHRQTRRYLARSQYHGMGNLESDVGVVVFNPSQLILERVVNWSLDQRSLIEADPNQLFVKAARDLCNSIRLARKNVQSLTEAVEPLTEKELRWETEKTNALLDELPRWQQCLLRFAARHQLSTTLSEIRQAVEAAIPLRISWPVGRQAVDG
jgi:hypothetical protein